MAPGGGAFLRGQVNPGVKILERASGKLITILAMIAPKTADAAVAGRRVPEVAHGGDGVTSGQARPVIILGGDEPQSGGHIDSRDDAAIARRLRAVSGSGIGRPADV